MVWLRLCMTYVHLKLFTYRESKLFLIGLHATGMNATDIELDETKYSRKGEKQTNPHKVGGCA